MLNIENPARILVNVGRSSSKTPAQKRAKVEEQRIKDSRMVKGRFNYIEMPGGTLKFHYKKYKEDPYIEYTMTDKHIYEIPLGVARHLNTNVGRYEHKYLWDSENKPSTLVGSRVRRCAFESLEFIDIEDIGPTEVDLVDVKLPPISK